MQILNTNDLQAPKLALQWIIVWWKTLFHYSMMLKVKKYSKRSTVFIIKLSLASSTAVLIIAMMNQISDGRNNFMFHTHKHIQTP